MRTVSVWSPEPRILSGLAFEYITQDSSMATLTHPDNLPTAPASSASNARRFLKPKRPVFPLLKVRMGGVQAFTRQALIQIPPFTVTVLDQYSIIHLQFG